MVKIGKITLLIFIGIVIGMVSFLNIFGSQGLPDPDKRVIQQLQASESDLSKPHTLDFFLYFPTEIDARAAQSDIHKKYSTFTADIHKLEQSEDWTLQLKGNLVPELTTLSEIRTYFDAVATRYSGEYDGWGAEIVR